jgi:hypothetical protein
MIRHAAAFAVLLLPPAAAAAQPDEGPPRWAANIARKQHVIMNGLPRGYASAHDPLPDTRAKLGRGATVFNSHCASCHGWNGQGTGPEAFALVPAPADLEWLWNKPKSKSESYMYWLYVLVDRRGWASVRFRYACLQEHAVEERHLVGYCLCSGGNAAALALEIFRAGLMGILECNSPRLTSSMPIGS